MKEKEIILCGIEDCDNALSWSGTHFNLYQQFKSRNRLKDTVNYEIEKSEHLTESLNWFSENFFIRRDTRDFFVTRHYERKFSKQFNAPENANDQVYLHISEVCVPPELTGKAIFANYTDATIKGLHKHKPYDKDVFPSYMRYIHWKTSLYLSRVSLMFTMNEWTRQSLIHDYSYPESRVFNVGFGVNVKPFYGPKAYDNQKLLIVLRRGTEHLKGLVVLFEAFKVVKKDYPLATLHVVGTTYEPLDGVFYYENFPRTKTEELFQECSLYVMPALYEVNGITYLEALASRVPIVGLNRYAFPEFCNYGEFGFIAENPEVADVAAAIKNALADPLRLGQMGTAGQTYAIQKYTWKRTVDLMIEAIDKYTT